jgi:hypothetical protein
MVVGVVIVLGEDVAVHVRHQDGVHGVAPVPLLEPLNKKYRLSPLILRYCIPVRYSTEQKK